MTKLMIFMFIKLNQLILIIQSFVVKYKNIFFFFFFFFRYKIILFRINALESLTIAMIIINIKHLQQ